MHYFLIGCLSLLYQSQPSTMYKTPIAWKKAYNKDDITVYKRQSEDLQHVIVQSVTTTDISLTAIVAVLLDRDNACQWQSFCKESRILKKYETGHFIYYHRIQSPVKLIRDRDAIIETKLLMKPQEKTVFFDFWSHEELQPEVNNTVHVKKTKGSFRCREISPTLRELTYEIYSDTGDDYLPSFVINYAAQDIAFNTLKGILKKASTIDSKGEVVPDLIHINWHDFHINPLLIGSST